MDRRVCELKEKNGFPTLRGIEKDVSQTQFTMPGTVLEKNMDSLCYKCCFLKQHFEGYERKS